MRLNRGKWFDPSTDFIILKSKLRKIATAIISSIICVSIFWGADLYLHRKHGINFWGYRGPAVGKKQPGEKRIAVLGGSTTWGFGLQAGQDFPAQLQLMLAHDQSASGMTIKVLNLGFNNEGAYSFTQTLNDYDYLDTDVVIFYSGYNDLDGPNYYNFRHRSPIFSLTGYLPLLPSLTVDKLSVWEQQLTGRNEKVVFRPPQSGQRSDSRTLRPQLREPEPRASPGENQMSAACSPKWQFYCERIVAASELALAKGKRVLIVGEPYIRTDHVEEQFELERMLRVRFAAEPHLRYLNLGRAVDLGDQSLCWDGMHLTEEGNRRIAAALTQPVLEMLR